MFQPVLFLTRCFLCVSPAVVVWVTSTSCLLTNSCLSCSPVPSAVAIPGGCSALVFTHCVWILLESLSVLFMCSSCFSCCGLYIVFLSSCRWQPGPGCTTFSTSWVSLSLRTFGTRHSPGSAAAGNDRTSNHVPSGGRSSELRRDHCELPDYGCF